jgi:CPA1 family monovalent cation:H+ antiporter
LEQTIAALAGIALCGIACQWLAWRVQLPAILFLLLAGILAGPQLGWLDPDALFGDLLFPMVSLAVAVILFEGSLTLRLEDIRGLEKVVRRLVTSGLLTTWVIVALATRAFVDFSWELSFLFGALVVVTGPTVIVPMLRTVRPNARVADVLRWEGIVIDPIGALLAVLVYDFLVARGEGSAFGHTLTTFGLMVGSGLAIGGLAGYALGWLLRTHLLPDYLRSVASLAAVCAAFAASNLLQPESGLLAVTVMGMWMANMKQVPLEDVLGFKESLSLLLISVLFIVLAARLRFDQLPLLGVGAVGVFLVVQFVARPLKVAVATAGSSLTWRERALLAWIAPRGIIAAAVSALFAPRLEQMGFDKADLLVPLTFVIIIGTVVLQSATARALARVLRVAEPAPKGMLIIGANPVARALGKALNDAGFRVLLVDNYWEYVSAARRAGLHVFYGSAVSDEADRRLDLVGIGQMLALSPQTDLNRLAILRYRPEFGRAGVYRLSAAPAPAGATGEHKRSEDRILFGDDQTYAKLAGMLNKGAEIEATKLTAEFDWEAFGKTHPAAVPLFAADERGRLSFALAGEKFEPGAGWTVHALHPGPAQQL